MSKITLIDQANLENETTFVTAYNVNNDTITEAMDNTLSRDGTAPNQMEATLDMNSNRIINLPEPNSDQEPLRLIDAATLNGGGTIAIGDVPNGGSTGQVLTKISNLDQDIDWQTPLTPPAGGTTNQVLTKNSATNYDWSWQNSAGAGAGIVTLAQYGAIGNGIVDDAVAIQNCFNAIAAAGGGIVYADPGKTYYVTIAPIIGLKTMFDMQGATLNMNLGHGNPENGIRFRSFSGIRNGTVNVTNASSVGSSQGFFGACLSIGDYNVNGDTVASPSVYSTATNIYVGNMTFNNAIAGRPVIQGMGAKTITIEDIYIPTSATCTGIHFDWTDVGGATVAGGSGPGGSYVNQAERLNAWKSAYNAGTVYTLHPQNIVIRNIRTGNLTLPAVGDFGARVVRLSACHNVEVSNINTQGTSLASYDHVGGDFGYEYAQSVDRLNAYKGNSLRGMVATNTYGGAYVDTWADNVTTAISQGYTPLGPEVYYGDIILEGNSTSGTSVYPGFDIQQCNGVVVRNNFMYGHSNGVRIQTRTMNTRIQGNTIRQNAQNGIDISGSTATEYLWIQDNWIHENGTTGSFAGIGMIGGPSKVWIQDNVLGIANDNTQFYGISITTGGSRVVVSDNVCREVKAGGTAFILGSTANDNTTFAITYNNSYVGSSGGFYSGIGIQPIASTLGITKLYRANRSSLAGDITPLFGSWTQGDIIFYDNPVASNYIGSVCTTTGSPGTWKAFGAVTA